MGIDSGNGTIARYVFTRLALVRVQEVRPGEGEIQRPAGAAHSKRFREFRECRAYVPACGVG